MNMPDWAKHVRPRLSSLRLSPAREAEIIEELSQHLQDSWRELVSGGMSPEQATRLALADFREGNLLARYLAPLRQAHAPTPVTPGTPTRFRPGDLLREVFYAGRMLRKQPGFAIAAILTLALAIGATTAIFAVVDALLLRSLPFPAADRLVQITRTSPAGASPYASIPKFVHWRNEAQQVLVDMAAYGSRGFNLTGSGDPERLMGSYVSAGFFDVMGVHPSLGRAFREDEDMPGGPKPIILSHALWRSRFGSSADIVGRAITLNNEPYTVIGVMPDGFRYPDVAELWTLSQFDPASQNRAHSFKVVARLQRTATLDQARAAMENVGSALRRARPDLMEEKESVGVQPLRDELYGNMRRPLFILLASVGFVLLIACVNVANLQLAQAAGRHHEIAVRTALGASTPAIVRQLLVESIVLGAIGGATGVALAYVGVPALLALSPVEVPYAERIVVDWRVLGFALGITLLASLAFGLLPAWRSARPNLDDVLRAGAHRVAGRTSRWVWRALVASEVALALMLTVGAFLLVKSLAGLQSTPPGFAVEPVLTMRLALPEARYGSGETGTVSGAA
jgi:putative ABC transport system permease protein